MGDLQAVIDGCQMDLEQTRYLDFAGLKGYCHLVAGIVGEVAARIFGQTDERTTQYVYRAHALDKAELVARVLQADGRGATMIFTRTKRTAQKVADDLAERGWSQQNIFLPAGLTGELAPRLRILLNLKKVPTTKS